MPVDNSVPRTRFARRPRRRSLLLAVLASAALVVGLAVPAAVANASTTSTVPAAVHHATVSPDSSSGEHDDVIITLIGSGLKVNEWETDLDYSYHAYDCVWAVFWYGPQHKANNIYHITPTECSFDVDAWYVDLGHSTTWANNTELCNTWNSEDDGGYGKPCEMVHK